MIVIGFKVEYMNDIYVVFVTEFYNLKYVCVCIFLCDLKIFRILDLGLREVIVVKNRLMELNEL